jgi:hypothetical protein
LVGITFYVIGQKILTKTTVIVEKLKKFNVMSLYRERVPCLKKYQQNRKIVRGEN